MAEDKIGNFQKTVEPEKTRPHKEFQAQDQAKAERAFERARQVEQRQQGQERGQEKRLESEQVKKSKPQMMPTPSGPMRSGPDAQAHTERSNSDNKAVQEHAAMRKAEALQKRQEQQPQHEKGKGQEL